MALIRKCPLSAAPRALVAHLSEPNYLFLRHHRQCRTWKLLQKKIGVMGSDRETSPTLQHSITPIPLSHRQFFFTQSTISQRLANQTSGNDLAYLIASS